jgi:hypothetical protein
MVVGEQVCVRAGVLVGCISIVQNLYRRLNWKAALECIAVACGELRDALAEADLFGVVRLPSKSTILLATISTLGAFEGVAFAADDASSTLPTPAAQISNEELVKKLERMEKRVETLEAELKQTGGSAPESTKQQRQIMNHDHTDHLTSRASFLRRDRFGGHVVRIRQLKP